LTFSTFNHLHLINFCHLGNKLFIYHTRPNQLKKKLLSSLMQFDEGIFKGQNFFFVFFWISSSSFYSCNFLRISIKNIRILFMDSEDKNLHSMSSLQGVSEQETVNNECWIRKIIFFRLHLRLNSDIFLALMSSEWDTWGGHQVFLLTWTEHEMDARYRSNIEMWRIFLCP